MNKQIYIMKMSQEDCNYMTVQELQLQYFQKELLDELNGFYFYLGEINNSIEINSEFYFLYQNKIIAKANLIGIINSSKLANIENIKIDKSFFDNKINIYLLDTKTIQIFEPINIDKFYEYITYEKGKEAWINMINKPIRGGAKKVEIDNNMYKELADLTKKPIELEDSLYKSRLYNNIFKRYFEEENLLNLTGLYYFENIHTYFLSNLLDINKNKIMGFCENNKYLPLIYLLKIIFNKTKKLKILENTKISDLTVKSQVKIGEKSIADLIIELKLNNKKYIVLLESKILSTENINQCKKYYDIINQKYDDTYEKIFVFLALTDNNQLSNNDEEINKKFIQITHQELLDNLYYKCYIETYNHTIYEYMQSFNYIIDKLLEEHYPIHSIPITKTLEEISEEIYYQYKDYLINEILKRRRVTNNEIIYIIRLLICIHNKVLNKKKDKELCEMIENFCKEEFFRYKNQSKRI